MAFLSDDLQSILQGNSAEYCTEHSAGLSCSMFLQGTLRGGVFAGFPNGVLYDVSLRHIVQCTRVECPVERFCRMPIQVVPVIRRMYLWSEVHMQIRVYPLEHTLEGILPEHTYDSPSALIVSRMCF